MKSIYKRIGDFIREINCRNLELKTTNLQGININKFFMPSVANVIGTDLTKYKIVGKNQFACNRMHVGRDKRLPIALSNWDEEFIVSPAYDVFEIVDTKILDPEYLMMWFSRREFDRNAWFYTDADVRGGLSWQSFSDMKLPVPSIEKQREIVKEYNTVVNRIKLNEELNKKLEETAQALYKHWFVDFEFPNKNGKPYKSNGGKMVYNEELEKEIPDGWGHTNYGNLMEPISGYAFKSTDFSRFGQIPILKIKSIKPPVVNILDVQFFNGELTDQLKRVLIQKGDILISMTGSGINQLNSAVGQVGRFYFDIISLINQRVCKLAPKLLYIKEYAYQFIVSEQIQKKLLFGSTGSANQANISPDQITNLQIVLPKKSILRRFEETASSIEDCKRIKQQSNLNKVSKLVLAKMSK